MTAPDELPLDNPIWHALRGPLAHLESADSTPEWIRFDRDVSPFSAVERIDEAVWDRVAEVAGSGGYCGLFRDHVPAPPSGWDEQFRGVCLQMVARDLVPAPGGDIEVLSHSDRKAMVDLAELTEPGPFLENTPRFGRYVGIRSEGRLVAMAGERFRVPGFVEVSAVCTHPEVRGQGHAAALTLEVARAIRAGGNEAMLHVLDSNEAAIRLYERLGFRVRREVDVVFAQWLGEESDSEL